MHAEVNYEKLAFPSNQNPETGVDHPIRLQIAMSINAFESSSHLSAPLDSKKIIEQDYNGSVDIFTLLKQRP